MKDSAFIQQLLLKGMAAKEKVKSEISLLNQPQLNWDPPNDNWSINQCLEHLIISDGLRIEKIQHKINANFKGNAWGRANPLSHFLGRILVSQTQERIKKKIKSPKLFQPSTELNSIDVLEKYNFHFDQIISTIRVCNDVDIDKIYITSPISSLITYSLRDALSIIMGHECRHIIQAVRIKKMKEFPQS